MGAQVARDAAQDLAAVMDRGLDDQCDVRPFGHFIRRPERAIISALIRKLNRLRIADNAGVEDARKQIISVIVAERQKISIGKRGFSLQRRDVCRIYTDRSRSTEGPGRRNDWDCWLESNRNEVPMAVSSRNLIRLGMLITLGGFALAAAQRPRGGCADAGGAEPVFESQVRPILEASCFKCHGGRPKIKGGLRLTSRAGC